MSKGLRLRSYTHETETRVGKPGRAVRWLGRAVARVYMNIDYGYFNYRLFEVIRRIRCFQKTGIAESCRYRRGRAGRNANIWICECLWRAAMWGRRRGLGGSLVGLAARSGSDHMPDARPPSLPNVFPPIAGLGAFRDHGPCAGRRGVRSDG